MESGKIFWRLSKKLIMKKLFKRSLYPFPSCEVFNWTMLLFRIIVSLELMMVHGFKKIGIGVSAAEQIPNPLHLPETINNVFAISANILFPFFVIIGFCTRVSTLPTLAVTLTGYFILHWNDAALVRDTPFMYSIVFLLILIIGPGKYSIDNYIYKKYQP
jgi:putative oxidoreductase